MYQRYTNPPEDKDAVIRWKTGSMKKYDQLPGGTWIEWGLYGRWNKLKWVPCEEPEVEKYYQQTK